MNSSQKGYFITLEGVDGAGKTRHAYFIRGQLKKAGQEVVLTREPGGTRLGDSVRQLLLNDSSLNISQEAELLLLFAARIQHVKEVIAPAIKANKIVVCDRFIDSSYAYQGGGYGISNKKIKQLEQWVFGDMPLVTKPDLTLLLDISLEVAEHRRSQFGLFRDRFEIKAKDFHQAVRNTFIQIAKNSPDRIVIINAAKTLTEVQSDILAVLVEKGLC